MLTEKDIIKHKKRHISYIYDQNNRLVALHIKDIFDTPPFEIEIPPNENEKRIAVLDLLDPEFMPDRLVLHIHNDGDISFRLVVNAVYDEKVPLPILDTEIFVKGTSIHSFDFIKDDFLGRSFKTLN